MDHALRLAEDDFATFPCNRSKAPACPHGFRDASTDAAAIRELWRRHRGELVGVATGAVSDLAALDVDAKHAEAHSWWDAQSTQLPQTRTIRTRSGGLHSAYRDAVRRGGARYDVDGLPCESPAEHGSRGGKP